MSNTVEPLLRGHPDERPPPLERPLDYVNLNINVLFSIPDERPSLLKGHFSGAKGVVSQEGFNCTCYSFVAVYMTSFCVLAVTWQVVTCGATSRDRRTDRHRTPPVAAASLFRGMPVLVKEFMLYSFKNFLNNPKLGYSFKNLEMGFILNCKQALLLK